MSHRTCVSALAAALAIAIVPLGGVAAPPDPIQKIQKACSAKTNATYGFQCSGFSLGPGGYEPVTFTGTVAGSETGVFEGDGIFSGGSGSLPLHAIGQADFKDKSCFGHIQYQITAGGGPFGTLDIDFAVVDGGFEVLGTPTTLHLDAAGVDVPVRMTCRLVRTRD